MPDFIVWFAGEVLVEDAMDVVPQREREILVEFDPHAAAVCQTGRSSRTEAAA